MVECHSTKFPGVRYREHETRKHGIRRDQYFAVRYQKDGERREEARAAGRHAKAEAERTRLEAITFSEFWHKASFP